MLEAELIQRHMETFAGYGNPEAPYWFIGMEEGGSSAESVLQQRYETWDKRGRKAFEDLRDFHLAMGGADQFFAAPLKSQYTWGRLIRILFAARGYDYTPEHALRYQSEKLGRSTGETVL